MSIQQIRLFGDPVLVSPASAVVDFDKELRKLVQDLTDTMIAAPGAGLAAPQIGVPLRVFVWDVDEALGHLINPTLDLSDDEQDGEPITVEGSELLARAIQHETDHLDGIVFIDRLDEETRKIAMKEIRESEWFGQASSTGITPTIKVSPHNTFGKGL